MLQCSQILFEQFNADVTENKYECKHETPEMSLSPSLMPKYNRPMLEKTNIF